MLGKLTEPVAHSDWVKMLPTVEYAINNTVDRATGFTPSQLLFGVNQKSKSVDYLAEYLEENKTVNVAPNLAEMRAAAAENIKDSQRYNEQRFRASHRPAKEYEEGDFVVMVHTDTVPGSSKKLIQKFRGPYRIHKKLPNDRYVLRDIDGCQMTQIPYDGVVEASRIKKWVE